MESQSELAAQQAGAAFDNAALREAAPLLKQKYRTLYTVVPGLTAPEKVTDKEIIDLTNEVLAGETERAKKIRQLPPVSSKIAAADKIRAAAVKSVYDNTGDFEFLGGSTVGNALSGVFTWLTDGKDNFFSKLFQLIAFIFTGFSQYPPGLRETIAGGAVSNTVNDFKANLQAQDIDTSQGLGQKAVEQFTQQAQNKANGTTLPDTPIDLSKVKMEAAPTVQPAKPVTLNGRNARERLTELLGREGTGIIDQIMASENFKDLPSDERPGVRAAMLKIGIEVMSEKKNQTLLQSGNLQELSQNFATALLADGETGKIIRKKAEEKSISNDKDLVPILALVAIRPLLQAHQQNLLTAITGQAVAGKNLTPEEKKVQEESTKQAKEKNRKLVKDQVAKTIEALPKPPAADLVDEIDAAIKIADARKYPGWGSRGFEDEWFGARWWKKTVNQFGTGDTILTRTLASEMPDNSDRKWLAEFSRDNLPVITKNVINDMIDKDKKFVTRDELVREIKKRFREALENDNNKNQKVWVKYHMDMVLSSVEGKLRTQLTDEVIDKIKMGLALANDDGLTANGRPVGRSDLGGLSPRMIFGNSPMPDAMGVNPQQPSSKTPRLF